MNATGKRHGKIKILISSISLRPRETWHVQFLRGLRRQPCSKLNSSTLVTDILLSF